MKFKIQAGATIDVATPKEVRDEIRQAGQSWVAELSKGDRFRRFSAAGNISDGVLTIGLRGDEIGPAAGMVWAVSRISVVNRDALTTAGLYLGSVESSSCVIPSLGDFTVLDANALVLYPGDRLVLAGTGTGPGRVWITGQARELPLPMAWRL